LTVVGQKTDRNDGAPPVIPDLLQGEWPGSRIVSGDFLTLHPDTGHQSLLSENERVDIGLKRGGGH